MTKHVRIQTMTDDLNLSETLRPTLAMTKPLPVSQRMEDLRSPTTRSSTPLFDKPAATMPQELSMPKTSKTSRRTRYILIAAGIVVVLIMSLTLLL